MLVALVPLSCGTKGEGGVDARSDDLDAADDLAGQSNLSGDSSGPVTFSTWPGSSTVTAVSTRDAFGPNLSGLVYEPASQKAPAILWAVQNEHSKG